MWPGGTQAMLSKVVCAYQVLGLQLHGFVWPKYHFLALFCPDRSTERGVATYMYLNHSPDNSDSKYIS